MQEFSNTYSMPSVSTMETVVNRVRVLYIKCGSIESLVAARALCSGMAPTPVDATGGWTRRGTWSRSTQSKRSKSLRSSFTQ